MKVLVTGGLGFIGSHLVDACVEKGYEVTVIDDLSTGKLENGDGFWKEVDIIRRSILDDKALDIIFNQPYPYSIIFHLAALPNVGRSIEDPIGTAEVNIMGTLKILERSTTHTIIASSSSVYGGCIGGNVKENQPLNPLSPYAVQKMSMENLSEQYSIHFDSTITCLRFFNVYGPRQRADSEYAGVIPSFLKAKEQGRAAFIYGDGLQSRDFTYVKDAVSALLAAAELTRGYNVFNVARGENTSILDLHKAIGSSIHPIYAPEREGDVRRSLANVKKILLDLDWSAKYSLKEGLEDMKLFCPK